MARLRGSVFPKPVDISPGRSTSVARSPMAASREGVAQKKHRNKAEQIRKPYRLCLAGIESVSGDERKDAQTSGQFPEIQRDAGIQPEGEYGR